MLALLEVRFDRFALHEAKRAERTPIEIIVEAGRGMEEVVFFVKGGDADEIDVSTKVLEVSDIKIVFENLITNQDGRLCTKGKTTLVCVNKNGMPTPMGADVKAAMMPAA